MCIAAAPVIGAAGIRSQATTPTRTVRTAAATNAGEKPCDDTGRVGEAAGAGRDRGEDGDTEGRADLVAGHQESRRHARVLGRDAGHRGDGDGDEDQADTEPEDDHAGQQVGREVGVRTHHREQHSADRGEAQTTGGDGARRRLRRAACRRRGCRPRRPPPAGGTRHLLAAAENPITVWTKIEIRKTVPTSRAVTPSITVVPDTSVVTFQVCGGTSGRAARRSTLTNAVSNTAAVTNAVSTRIEPQPCAEVLARPNIRAARPPMTVRAPGRSNWARLARAPVSLGRTLSPRVEGDDADRDVDPEDELPAGPGGQRPAEQDAGGDAEASDGAPQGEALGALGAGVRRHHQGQRGGGHQGGAESLGGAGGDELGGAAGEPAEQ